MSSQSTQPSHVKKRVEEADLTIQVDQRLLEHLHVCRFQLRYEMLGFATLEAIVRNHGSTVLRSTDVGAAFFGKNGVKLEGQAYLNADVRPGESTHLVLFYDVPRFLGLPFSMLLAPAIAFAICFLLCVIVAILAALTGSATAIVAAWLFNHASIALLLPVMLVGFLRPDVLLVWCLGLVAELTLDGKTLGTVVLHLSK